MNEYITTCPHCGITLDDGDILDRLRQNHPEYAEDKLLEAAGYYGWSDRNKIRFSRIIGIKLDRDRVEFYQCPDCHRKIDNPYKETQVD